MTEYELIWFSEISPRQLVWTGVSENSEQKIHMETAFYQIGCSSPEVQLVRMIYAGIIKKVMRHPHISNAGPHLCIFYDSLFL